jgi:AraC-like DNA-binding protein
MAARHPPCRALKPKEKDYKVTDRDGMYVHVTAKGAIMRQLGLADSRLSQISLAVRWIREHAEMLRIEDLARVANMSATSFFRHFRALTLIDADPVPETGPAAGSAGQTLASPGDVAAVGYPVGYDSPSQFSREYRRLFGAPPGRDTARLADLRHPPPGPREGKPRRGRRGPFR